MKMSNIKAVKKVFEVILFSSVVCTLCLLVQNKDFLKKCSVS